MRARIIFRGLTLFRFKKTSRGAAPNSDLGTLEALLVSDKRHDAMPLHRHTPYRGLIGRDRDLPNGPEKLESKVRITADMRIEMMGHELSGGVTVDESFLEYVPCLSDFDWGESSGLQDAFITRRIIIPHGRIRTRDFITWDWHGNTPTRVAYMDTTLQGFGANEVIVDIGDDSDINNHDMKKYLAVTDLGNNRALNLWPRAKGAAADEDIDPNTVELLITNLPARRRRAVFWGLHFQTLFDAAGYTRRPAYRNTAQYTTFVDAATEYDNYEWQNDVGPMGIGHPFPFLIDPEGSRLDGLSDVGAGEAVVPPLPPGRRNGEGVPAGGAGGHGGMQMGHDPENTQICPFGRE